MTFGLKTAGQWPQQLWRRFAATIAALFLNARVLAPNVYALANFAANSNACYARIVIREAQRCWLARAHACGDRDAMDSRLIF